MTSIDRWQLPDGVEEVLPVEAAMVETLRRRLLDLYRGWGYQQVIPPLVEFTESLLIGLGQDLDLLTFKVTDQLSGRTLGIRADITPQVARIDAHSLAETGVSRLCYAGSTLHTRPQSLLASRSPIQLGAELYGEAGLAADIEIIQLMMATLDVAGIEGITLDLGHVGVCEAVLAAAGLQGERESEVFDALQRKSLPDLQVALDGVDPSAAALVTALLDLHGDASVLARARELYHRVAPAAVTAVEVLADVSGALADRLPGLSLYFDLAELRGYHYHTGIVFAAYAPGHGRALANGGRYDHVGAVFGRSRPATGFATDLKALLGQRAKADSDREAISAPDSPDPALAARVEALRREGEVVINRLSGAADSRCSRELVHKDGEWQLQPLSGEEPL